MNATAVFVIAGDVVDGLKFIGPFDTPSEAISWATDHCAENWILGHTISPEDYIDG